jgi:hypothetical protein
MRTGKILLVLMSATVLLWSLAGPASAGRFSSSEPVRAILNREAGGGLTSVNLGGTIRSGAECFATGTTIRGTSSSVSAGILTLI